MILSLLSCSGESVEIKNTVTAYNNMLTEALAKPDPRVMEYFTTHAEKRRISSYIMFLRKDKRLLVSEIKKLEFDKINITKDRRKANVSTRESWQFHYIDEKTRKRISEDQEKSYENLYFLVKDEGRWVVDRLEIRKER